MKKHLYFVCPTDQIETFLNKNYQEECYYLTSLGNSITFSPRLIKELNVFIDSKGISEITFILSTTNKLILDALTSKDFKQVRGIKRFYRNIVEQKKRTSKIWQVEEIQIPVISSFLNSKTRELQYLLGKQKTDYIKVNAKIYNRRKKMISDIQPDLLILESFRLN